MQTEFFMQGLMLGLAYAAPIGIQNMYVINAALSQQRAKALACGLTVAFFDVTLALACFFGIGTFIDLYPAVKSALMVLGGLVLICMGGKMLFAAQAQSATESFAPKFSTVVWTAFVLTWFNPQAVIDGTMILGAMYASLVGSQRFSFIVGVSAASLLWFTLLAAGISTFKTCFSGKLLKYINIVCGAIIIFFGARLIFKVW